MTNFDPRAELMKMARESYNQGRIDSLETFKDGMEAVLRNTPIPEEQKDGIRHAISCANLSIANYEAEKNQ